MSPQTAPGDEDGDEDLAAQVWRRLFGFVMHTRPQRDAVLEELGLTPNDARALYSLEADRGRRMSDLARAWKCDASTATWAVDRLERSGLAERRAHPDDRRIRLVVLTGRGVSVRERLLNGMQTPPPELLDLDRTELEQLRTVLDRLPRGLEEFPDPG